MHGSKVNNMMIGFVVLALVLLAAYVGFFIHIGQKQSAAAMTLAEIEQLQNENDQLQGLNSVLRTIQEDQEKLSSFFVDGDAIVEFLEAIEQVGIDSGVDAEVRSIDEVPTRNPTITELVLNLTAKGSWSDIYHFLVLLENFPVVSTFDRIQMSAITREDDASTEWRGVFNMKVLQLKQ